MLKWMIENWFSLISALGLGFGGYFSLKQWHVSNKIKRAEFIDQILEKLRFNEKSVEAMYQIDYNQTWYDDNFHGSGGKEYAIDRLLSYLSY